MIQQGIGLDPRGQPKDGMMEFIGGPRDGERWPMTSVPPKIEGGRYAWADTRAWAFVWVAEGA